jgi:DNA polymerase I
MPFIYLDIETDNTEQHGLDVFQSKIVTLQLLLPSGKVIIVKDPKNLDTLKPVLENNVVIGHNLKFDLSFLKYHFGININNIYDTMIAELILSDGLYAGKKDVLRLKNLVQKYCGEHMDKTAQTSFVYGIPLTSVQEEYAANDLRYLPKIFNRQWSEIKKKRLERVVQIEMNALPALVWLELSGIKVDLEKLENIEKEALQLNQQAKLEALTLLKDSTINLNSSQQLKKALHKIGVMCERTDAEELSKFNHPVITALRDYKSTAKFMSTFTTKLPTYINPVTGRVHASYKQIGAVTGRLSCEKPNMQQQPSRGTLAKHYKEIFTADKGKCIVTADYSQIELRIVGQAAHDKKYIDAYNTKGVDLHKRTAATLFHIDEKDVNKVQRGMAKSINFGLNYGMMESGLIRKIKADTGEDIDKLQAAKYIKDFQTCYPEVTEYLNRSSLSGVKNHYVKTLTGRIIGFETLDTLIKSKVKEKISKYKIKYGKEPNYQDITHMKIKSRNEAVDSIRRQSKNYPIQGFCADLLKIAIRGIFLKLELLGVKFIATVHDEVVFECDEIQKDYVKQVVKEEMEHAGDEWFTDIPCVAEVFDAKFWHKD